MNAKFTNVTPIFLGTGGYTNGTSADASAVYAAVNPPPIWESLVYIPKNEVYTVPPKSREWLLRDIRNDREGVFPLGKVGILAAAGGVGKTQVESQFGLAVATGGTWLGCFDIPKPGRVLLVLGEEDQEEVGRRLHRSHKVSEILPPEGSVHTLPLHGHPSPLITKDGADAPFIVWLREYLRRTGPYMLVILDPLSRFAAGDVEQDNDAATRFLCALESLVEPSGGAAVLASHHTSQEFRGNGQTLDIRAVRGVTGLGDAARWVSVMGSEHLDREGKVETVVTLSMVKSNYSRIAPPVLLRFDASGAIIPMTGTDVEAREQAREAASPKVKREKQKEEKLAATNAKIDATVVNIVTANQDLGTVQLKVDVAAAAGCSQEAAGIAIARVRQAGLIKAVARPKGEGKGVRHVIVEHPVMAPPPPLKSDVSNTSAAPVFVLDDIDEKMIDEQLGATPKGETPKTDRSTPTAADVYAFLDPNGGS